MHQQTSCINCTCSFNRCYTPFLFLIQRFVQQLQLVKSLKLSQITVILRHCLAVLLAQSAKTNDFFVLNLLIKLAFFVWQTKVQKVTSPLLTSNQIDLACSQVVHIHQDRCTALVLKINLHMWDQKSLIDCRPKTPQWNLEK